MRNDLTANFLAAMASDSRTPIQVLQFQFSAGWVHLSDRDGIYSGFPCQNLVENWGSLSTSGEENSISGTMEMSVSIWNGGEFPFSNNFFEEDPMNVEVWVYQTFEGLDNADAALIGTFVVQDPIRFTEGSRLLALDLVTVNMRYFGQVGSTLTRDQYPYALEADVNKSIDLIVGECGEVETLCSVTPSTCTQSGSILLLPTTINTLEDLDELGFFQSGYIQIDAEILGYSSRTANSFNVTSRGVNLPGLPTTVASDHSDGSVILQANIDVEYIVGQGPLDDISNVLVNGQVPTVPYTPHRDLNPAVIRFKAQPVYTEFSRGARSIDVDLDAVTGSNTAQFPERAYDTDFRSYGAIISRDYPRLSIIQNDTALDDGEVVRVFLNVEHWATGQYNNDNCYVYAQGVYLGSLAKPDVKDTIELEADVDVDHGHAHSVGGIHDHGYTDSTLATDNVPHDHTATGFGETYVDSGEIGFPYSIGAYSNSEERFYYSGHSNIESQTLHFRARQQTTGEIDLVFGDKTVTWQPGTANIDQYITTTAYSTKVTIRVDGEGVINSYLEILEMTLESTTGSDINPRTTSIDTSHITSGVVALQNVGTDTRSFEKEAGTAELKAEDDVDRITEEERIKELNVISADTSSKRVTEKYDITKHLPSVSWEWLHGKVIDIVYSGSQNDVEVVITYVHFEVEYRQKQIRTTNNVTANVTGHYTTGWRPDMVIQYLLMNKAGVPPSALGSVWRSIPVWDDSETWNDSNVWQDEGQVVGAQPGAYFEEASSWFAYRAYTIDGAIPGNMSVKDAIAQLTFQTRSRLLWQNGQAKLVVLRKTEGWNIAKDLETDVIQMRSLSVEKTPLSEIINKIELCYDIDYLSDISGAGQYRSTAVESDSTSIAKNGERQQEELFLFNYVKRSSMASDIADYYIWLYGESRSLYGLSTYLPNFDLEKSDYISINSTGFQQLNRLPVTIRELVRNYGSGKNGIINTLDILGESIRHKIYSIKETDDVYVFDNLSIFFGFELDFDDIANVTDILLIVTGKEFEDSVIVGDDFSATFTMSPKLKETAVATDELTTVHDIYIDDEVIVNEDFTIAQELCWGACGWGAPNCNGPVWGSKTVHKGASNEYMSVTDTLVSAMSGVLEDTATVTDQLCFSDGWGCPTGSGDGFGLSPFGDTFCTTT